MTSQNLEPGSKKSHIVQANSVMCDGDEWKQWWWADAYLGDQGDFAYSSKFVYSCSNCVLWNRKDKVPGKSYSRFPHYRSQSYSQHSSGTAWGLKNLNKFYTYWAQLRVVSSNFQPWLYFNRQESLAYQHLLQAGSESRIATATSLCHVGILMKTE